MGRSRPRGSIHSLLRSKLYLDHSHSRARASYSSALPSTRAIPDRDVFYVTDPIQLHCFNLRLANNREIKDAVVFNAEEIELSDNCAHSDIEDIQLHR